MPARSYGVLRIYHYIQLSVNLEHVGCNAAIGDALEAQVSVGTPDLQPVDLNMINKVRQDWPDDPEPTCQAGGCSVPGCFDRNPGTA